MRFGLARRVSSRRYFAIITRLQLPSLSVVLALCLAVATSSCRTPPRKAALTPQQRHQQTVKKVPQAIPLHPQQVAAMGAGAVARPQPQLTGSITNTDDIARFIAGLPARKGTNSPLEAWRARTSWEVYSQRMEGLWGGYLDERGDAIPGWRQKEMPDLVNARTVFYPFSGPDFLYAHAFFPGASDYLLVGLEEPEALPDLATLSDIEIAYALDGLHDALVTILGYSFFVTKEMRSHFANTRLQGTLPPLLVFLARTGHRIDRVTPISIAPDGSPRLRRDGWSKHKAAGFEITCFAPSGMPRRVTYLRADLSDSGDPRVLKYANSKGAPVTLLKSASYLMHENGFNRIRGHILNQSVAILQDASGVPYRDFHPAVWDSKLYGNYGKVLDLFQEHYQPDLRQAYDQAPPRPLRFGIGYEYEAEVAAIILARKKR